MNTKSKSTIFRKLPQNKTIITFSFDCLNALGLRDTVGMVLLSENFEKHFTLFKAELKESDS